MTQVVIATHNRGKVRELRLLLAETAPGVELVAYDGPEPVTTTFMSVSARTSST